MQKNNSVVLTSLAKEDLLDCFLKGIDEWGNQQAQDYAEQIDNTIQLLAQNPNMGAECHQLYNGARCFPIGRHIIYYRFSNNTIEVARILHQRMNESQHLK